MWGRAPARSVLLFANRGQAEEFIAEVRSNELDLADLLRVWPLDVGREPSLN